MVIKGIYTSTLFRNESNNYTVFSLHLSEIPDDYEWTGAICVGYLYASCIGMPMRLEGEFQENNEYEKPSFIFTDMELVTETEQEISGLAAFDGISEKIIEALVANFGVNVFDWAKIPDIFPKLTAIDGIGPKKAQKIIDGITAYSSIEDFYKYVVAFGEAPVVKSSFICSDMIGAIQKEPYRFGHKCSLSFKTCDMIAKSVGFEANNPKRIRALCLDILDRAYQKGNTCLPLERFISGVDYTSKHYGVYPNEDVSPYFAFAEAVNNENIKLYDASDGVSYVFLERVFRNESLLATNILRLEKSKQIYSCNIDRIISQCEQELNIQYSNNQKEAFRMCLTSSGLKVITGGPGTGKTTVINGIVRSYEILFPKKTIKLMAPTGRASQRMSEVTGKDAGTIHRSFNLRSIDVVGHLEKCLMSDYIANYPADLIIIDETSMLDDELAAYALSSIRSGSTVIFVGDIDQLPSVGAGNVLHEIIESDIIDTVRLNINYRSGDISTIAINSEKIKNGETDLVTDDTFCVSKCLDRYDMKNRIRQVFMKHYDKNDPFQTQVLCAVKDSRTAGVVDYNKTLQSLSNPNPSLLQTHDYEYKKGDKVIITTNNYDDYCFNGDIGVVTDLLDENITINLTDKEVVYSRDRYDEVQLAYAMTIHKSQGSEYKTVIICLPEQSCNMLQRRLLYTAVTRAKERVYIFYTGESLNKAIINNNDIKRISLLKEMIVREVD